jgi:hypothetical protein
VSDVLVGSRNEPLLVSASSDAQDPLILCLKKEAFLFENFCQEEYWIINEIK